MDRPIQLANSRPDTRPLMTCDSCNKPSEQASGLKTAARFICGKCVFRRASGHRPAQAKGSASA